MIEGGSPPVRRWATTDANGAFVFPDLPPGRYTTSVSSGGWRLTQPTVDVDGVNDPDVLIVGVPEPQGRLTASAAFTQQVYNEGDTARAILTLHNTSDVVLTDLIAACRVPQVSDADAGELSPAGPGVTLPAGTTREFVVTAPVRFAQTGHIRLVCWLEGRTSFYNFRVVGPWSIVPAPWQSGDGSEVIIVGGPQAPGPQHTVFVMPGPYQTDPDPAPPAGAAPRQGTEEPYLAVTGADVTWLALSGVLTLLIGACLVLVSCRGHERPGSHRGRS